MLLFSDKRRKIYKEEGVLREICIIYSVFEGNLLASYVKNDYTITSPL